MGEGVTAARRMKPLAMIGRLMLPPRLRRTAYTCDGISDECSFQSVTMFGMLSHGDAPPFVADSDLHVALLALKNKCEDRLER